MEKFQLATLSDSHPLVNEIRDVLEKGTQQKIAFLQVDKMKKNGGVPTKDITFNFENGQTLTITLRKDGDIIKTIQNKKVIPISKVMDLDNKQEFIAGLDEIALRIKANQPKFDLARQKQKVVIPNDPAKRRKAVRVKTQENIQHLKELNQQIEEKQKVFDAKQNELQSLQDQHLKTD